MIGSMGSADKRIIRGMLMPLGTAENELAEVWNEMIRNNRQSKGVGGAIEIAYGTSTLYGMGEIPSRAIVDAYVIGNKTELDLLELLGEFSYPDEPYMLVSCRINGYVAPVIEKLDDTNMSSLGARLLYDVRQAPLESVDQRRPVYRYTGKMTVPQDIVDAFVYKSILASVENERNIIEKALGLTGPLSRQGALEGKMSALFNDGTQFGGIDALKMLEDQCETEYRFNERIKFSAPTILFDEDKASDSIVEQAKRIADLYVLVSYLIESARERGIEIQADEWMGGVNEAREIRRFAESEGWDSTVDLYNSGMPVEDIIA